MKKKIAVLAGDGIGPEVIEQAMQVLDAVAERFGHQFIYCKASVGAIAIDKTGDPLPATTLDACLNSDAILFGAIGHPKYDNDPSAKVRPEQGLLRLRKSLGLFCNIRPVSTYPKLMHLSPLKAEKMEGVDLVIYRELTGGIYFGEKGRTDAGLAAFDRCDYHTVEIERIAKLAFEAAGRRRQKLTLVDKANVLETSRLWREVIQKMAPQYADIEVNYMFVDNAAMQLIVQPNQFDVVLTENMFGDILSDEASVLVGSLGMLPSASIGEKHAMFEPCHGSYPQAAGKDIANPMATVLSAAMMLDHFGLQEEADCVRRAVYTCLQQGIGTADLNIDLEYNCTQVGEMITTLVSEKKDGLNSGKMSEGISTII